jgi:hypothetical protein
MAAGQNGGAQHLDLKVALIGVIGLCGAGHGSHRDGGQCGGGLVSWRIVFILKAALSALCGPCLVMVAASRRLCTHAEPPSLTRRNRAFDLTQNCRLCLLV